MNVETRGDRTGKSGKSTGLLNQSNKSSSVRRFSKPRVLFRFCGALLFAFFLAVCICPSLCRAQDDERDVAPPPLKIISKEERKQLESVTDVKNRTKLALELIEARLLKAETFHTEEKYREMFDELGGFHALMDNTIDFLSRSDTNQGKVLNNFKRVELSLRKYVTRLEIVRRDLPVKYELYVRQLIRYVREARSRAVEPLFDDKILPGNKPN